jgi:hypothetical protein
VVIVALIVGEADLGGLSNFLLGATVVTGTTVGDLTTSGKRVGGEDNGGWAGVFRLGLKVGAADRGGLLNVFVGAMVVGISEGEADGRNDGRCVLFGALVGLMEGISGLDEGRKVGDAERGGLRSGFVGAVVVLMDGLAVGVLDGGLEGLADGFLEGPFVGFRVGTLLGKSVGG